MKFNLIVVVLFLAGVLLSPKASAEGMERVLRNENVVVVLQDKPCTNDEIKMMFQLYFPGAAEPKQGRALVASRPVELCWAEQDGVPVVIDSNGSGGHLGGFAEDPQI